MKPVIVTHIDLARRMFEPRAIAELVRATNEAYPEYKARRVQVGLSPDTWVILVTEPPNEEQKTLGVPLPFVGFIR